MLKNGAANVPMATTLLIVVP
ncbi:unnamed protein product, partial [Adineta steineri]